MTARVYSLMHHYWPEKMTIEARAMVIADWRAVLGDIPQEAIELGVAEKLRETNWPKPDYKPSAGEIRKRALRFVIKPPLTVADNRSFPPVAVDEDVLERRRRQQPRICGEFPMLKQIPRA